jgi:hypothetical protein
MGGLFGILIPCRDNIFPHPLTSSLWSLFAAASEIALAFPLSAIPNEALSLLADPHDPLHTHTFHSSAD